MEPVTLGELWRRQEDHRNEDHAAFKDIDDRLASSFVPLGTYQAERQSLMERIKRMEDRYDADTSWRRNLSVAIAVSGVTSVIAIITAHIH